MAYNVINAESNAAVINANNNARIINNAVKALLHICPQEGYANGNSGYSQAVVRLYFKTLSECGVSLQQVRKGNACTVGVYAYVIADSVTAEQADKAYKYALAEIEEYAYCVSDNDRWKKWRVLHALATLKPDAVSIEGCIVSLNGTKFSEYANIEKMLPEIFSNLEKGV